MVRWPLIVIGCWIAVAAALTLLLPTLQAQAAKREQAPLPPGAPSMVLQKEMSAAFQEKIETSALLLVLLTNENGLGPADEAVYRKLIENLRADTQDKISVQDFLAVPEMKELLASKDNKAWNLPITFAGDAASPETQAAFKRVAAIVKQTVAGTSLTVHLSGPIATVADLTELGEKDVRIIEIGTAVSVLIILILVYRNLVTMLVPLATIGASVVTAQGTLSGLAEFGLAVNMQAIVFMSAVMIGGGNRLRRLSDKSLSRLCAPRRKIGHGGQEGVDVHRQGDHRIGGHRRRHISGDGVHQTGSVFGGGPGNCGCHHGVAAGCGHPAARHPDTHRTAGLDQAATRPDQSNVAAFGCSHRASVHHPPGRQSHCAGRPGRLHAADPIQLRRSQDGAAARRKRQRIRGDEPPFPDERDDSDGAVHQIPETCGHPARLPTSR